MEFNHRANNSNCRTKKDQYPWVHIVVKIAIEPQTTTISSLRPITTALKIQIYKNSKSPNSNNQNSQNSNSRIRKPQNSKNFKQKIREIAKRAAAEKLKVQKLSIIPEQS